MDTETLCLITADSGKVYGILKAIFGDESEIVKKLIDFDVSIRVVPLNLGLLNIFRDNAADLDNADLMKRRFGNTMGSRIVEAYRRSQDSKYKRNVCKTTGLLVCLFGGGLGLSREADKHKKFVEGKSHNILSVEMLKRALSIGGQNVDANKISSFWFATYTIFTTVYSPRLRYQAGSSKRIIALSESRNQYRSNLFWDLRDDSSHEVMSMVHVLSALFASALTAYISTRVRHELTQGNDERESLNNVLVWLKTLTFEPSTIALIAYIWLVSPTDAQATITIGSVMESESSDDFPDIVKILSYTSNTMLPVQLLEDGRTAYCSVADGYTRHTTALTLITDYNSSHMSDKFGVLINIVKFEHAYALHYVHHKPRDGKEMTITSPSSEMMFTSVVVTPLSSYPLIHARNAVIDWLRTFVHMFPDSGSLVIPADSYTWIHNLAQDMFPWVQLSTTLDIRDDHYFQVLCDCLSLGRDSRNHAKVEKLIKYMKASVYNFTSEARGNMLLAITVYK
ncbi:nonstructural protein [Rice dwarf virus]|uniref:Movement protein n=1 Tax=Rice dwarf virus (isolate Fujian) TaxID=142804 RepID=MVP_RDVF|nr:nonstructural protein [Rice dwarf virus]Q85438.1 RecName: Full=Movement protein; AltName: Full=Non-structural protein 6; Short=Pns6 [Rice dwarf virus (isolate Fujian)]AAA88763.1 nonstructural protein [Rice dwarf virus]